MCRGKAEGGRRCPCDTTEGRRERAKRAKLRKQYEGLSSSVRLVERPIITIPESPIEETPEQRLERVSMEAQEMFNKMRFEDSNVNYEVLEDNLDARIPVRSDKFENIGLMGAKIHELAEAFNGGPFDEAQLEKQLLSQEGRARLSSVIKSLKKVKDRQLAQPNNYVDWYGEDSFSTEVLTKIGVVVGDSRLEAIAKARDFLTNSQNEFYANRAECYRRALEVVGVEFGGAELANVNSEVSKKIAKKTLATIESASRFIPKTWLEDSNQRNDLLIRETTGRAHLAYGKTIALTSDVVTAQEPLIKESFEKFLKHTRTTEENWFDDPFLRISYMSVDPNAIPEDGIVFHEPTGMKVDVSGIDLDNQMTMSNGWKVIDTGLVPSVKKRGDGIKKSRDGVSYYVSGRRKARVTELTISGTGSEAESTFYHEFCHRQEQVNPIVVDFEEKFLKSRIAEGEKLQRIPNHNKGEIGFRDSFFEPYCGRVYRSYNGDSRNFEIMSMGVESLFYGGNGGFSGNARDDDYRNFVLGVLASTGNRSGVRGEPIHRDS